MVSNFSAFSKKPSQVDPIMPPIKQNVSPVSQSSTLVCPSEIKTLSAKKTKKLAPSNS